LFLYFMVYNISLGPNLVYQKPDKSIEQNYDMELVALKLSIDNAFLEHKAKVAGLDFIPKIEQEIQGFPTITNRVFADMDAISLYGTFYLIMVPLSIFMVIYDEMVREKCDKLRIGMCLLGVQDSAYYCSWFISALFLVVYSSVLMILICQYYGFLIFARTPGWVFFVLFLEISICYIALAFFAVTITQTKAQGFSVNFMIIMCAIFVNILLCETSSLKKVFFNTQKNIWLQICTDIFYLNPSF
jgi:hypothetical protein